MRTNAQTYDQYLIDVAAEELFEIGQRLMKVKRFGIEEAQPGQDKTNRQRLEDEINDFLGVVSLLQKLNIIGEVGDEAALEAKRQRIYQYATYSFERGLCEKPAYFRRIMPPVPIEEDTLDRSVPSTALGVHPEERNEPALVAAFQSGKQDDDRIYVNPAGAVVLRDILNRLLTSWSLGRVAIRTQFDGLTKRVEVIPAKQADFETTIRPASTPPSDQYCLTWEADGKACSSAGALPEVLTKYADLDRQRGGSLVLWVHQLRRLRDNRICCTGCGAPYPKLKNGDTLMSAPADDFVMAVLNDQTLTGQEQVAHRLCPYRRPAEKTPT